MSSRTSSFSKVVVTCSLAIAIMALAGCRLHPNLVSAQSHRVDSEEIVQIIIRSTDAKKIKNRQLYFSVVVGECGDNSDGYPAESYIGGEPASGFKFATGGETVAIVGRVPTKVFDRYQRPCALLRGGGYFTGKILSSSIPITVASGEGPNNSFKPTPLRGSA